MAKITTITNPLTGQPAQVDQLDHTAQEIDDAIARALPGGAIDQRVSMLPGQNLTDNGVFIDGCLVDQRQGRIVKPNTTYYSDNQLTTSAGTTSAYVTAYRYATGTASGVNYASFKLTDTDDAPTYYAAPSNAVRGYTGAGYGPDRWKNYSDVTALVESDCLTLRNNTSNTGYCGQIMEDGLWDALVGKTVTMSVLRGDGALYSATGEFGTNISFYVENGVNAYMWPNGKEPFDFSIAAGASIAIRAIKLELGDHQTLAHQDADGNWQLNELPNYADTLAMCQRYQLLLKTGCGIGVAKDDSTVYILVPLPKSMRIVPVLEYSGDVTLYPGGGTVTSVSINSDTNAVNSVVLTVNGSGFTAGKTYFLRKFSGILNANL